MKAHRRWIAIGAVVLALALGVEALRTMLSTVHVKDVRAALRTISPMRTGAALGLTMLSYLTLTLYDTLALRTIGAKLPWRIAALASFTSYTISHNLGLSFLTGGTARYRIYSSAGLSLSDVARIGLIASATFWGGVLTIAGLTLATGTQNLDIGVTVISPLVQQFSGFAILAAIGAAFALRWRGVDRIGYGGFTVPIPHNSTMAAQIGVAALDLTAASAALFVLVPDAAPHLFGTFFLAYALAILAALITHVPGGLGVFEAVILAIVPGKQSEIFAALLLYRVIYYVLPLAAAGAMLGLMEGYRQRRQITLGVSIVARASRSLAPTLLALLVATGGLVLVVSGATPALHARIGWLAAVVPLPFVETSHFFASLAGTALLLVAPAINARLRAGFHAARILLVGGAIFSLSKGLDYEEASVLIAIAAILQYSRPAFYRLGGVLDAPLQRTWFVLAAVVLGGSLWAGGFAYKRIEYANDLWWAFAYSGNAPRFLRASLGALVLLGGVALWRLLWTGGQPQGLQILPPDVAERAFAVSPRADAALALTGDKLFLLSQSHDAFLMYRVRGRTWVVMGDPVGPVEAWPELVWAARAACDAARGRLCIYQASDDMLPLLVELGLQVMKYGEEAEVDLTAFSLDGPRSAKLRHTVRRCEAIGLTFEIIPAADVPAIGPELQDVSEAWLKGKSGGEKGFSVGRFDRDYLTHFDFAVLRLDGRIVAFANIWQTLNRTELSVDLMRHLPETPNGTMDFLFVRLMQWGASEGYGQFNLGMAPLSGLSGARLAPAWSRIGHAIYGHAELLYGFSGLRSFKEKFRPLWVPRYVATPPGLAAPRAIVDLFALISG